MLVDDRLEFALRRQAPFALGVLPQRRQLLAQLRRLRCEEAVKLLRLTLAIFPRFGLSALLVEFALADSSYAVEDLLVLGDRLEVGLLDRRALSQSSWSLHCAIGRCVSCAGCSRSSLDWRCSCSPA